MTKSPFPQVPSLTLAHSQFPKTIHVCKRRLLSYLDCLLFLISSVDISSSFTSGIFNREALDFGVCIARRLAEERFKGVAEDFQVED